LRASQKEFHALRWTPPISRCRTSSRDRPASSAWRPRGRAAPWWAVGHFVEGLCCPPAGGASALLDRRYPLEYLSTTTREKSASGCDVVGDGGETPAASGAFRTKCRISVQMGSDPRASGLSQRTPCSPSPTARSPQVQRTGTLVGDKLKGPGRTDSVRSRASRLTRCSRSPRCRACRRPSERRRRSRRRSHCVSGADNWR
jgi:hypothetical protein